MPRKFLKVNAVSAVSDVITLRSSAATTGPMTSSTPRRTASDGSTTWKNRAA